VAVLDWWSGGKKMQGIASILFVFKRCKAIHILLSDIVFPFKP